MTTVGYGLKLEGLRGAPLFYIAEGVVKMEKGKASVIKKIDLRGVFEGIKELNSRMEAAFAIKRSNNTDADLTEERENLRKEANILQNDVDRLYETVGVMKRTRRGLLDIGGEGLKFMFGTMSSGDAKEIRGAIEGLNDGQREIVGQLKSTVTIIDQLNRANSIIKSNQDKEKKWVDDNIKLIRNYLKEEQGTEEARKIHESLGRWIISARLEVVELREALLFLKTGVVDPFILERGEMVEAINRTNAGYTINKEDVDDLYRISGINTFINSTSGAILVVINVPTVHDIPSELYSLNGIPQWREGKRVVISGYNKFLLISKDKRTFWKGDEFNHVRIGDTIIGKDIPWYTLRENSSCESNVFQFKSDRMCVYSDWNEDGEVEIITNQGYLIIWPEARAIRYTCGKEAGNLTINEPTFIQSELECDIKSGDFEIQNIGKKASIELNDMFIRIDCCSNFNSRQHTLKLNYSSNLVLDEVVNQDVKIKELQEIVTQRQNHHREVVFAATSPVLLVIAILAVCWYARECRRSRAMTIVDAEWTRSQAAERF